jgi:hypothetical protein
MMRTFSLLVALCIFVTTATTARPGYLAAGYPAPLRFSDPEGPAKAALPPLPKDQPEASFPIPTNTMTRCDADDIVTSAPEQSATVMTPADAQPPSVTPHMLVDYFRSGTSGTNHNVTAVVPFGFVPPASGPTPSSSATYISR